MKYISISAKIGQYVTEDFKKSKKDFSSLNAYCTYLFKQINRKYWNNKYPEINFGLLTNKITNTLDLDTKILGCYWYKDNTIYFRPEVWNLNDEQIIHLVKHELTHYFNHYDKIPSNHGKYFKRYMRQMGEKGTKIANEDIARDLSEDTKKEYDEFQNSVKRIKNMMLKDRHQINYDDCKPGVFALVLYEKKWQILTGFFTGAYTNKSKEFYVMGQRNLSKSSMGHTFIKVTKNMFIVSVKEKEEKQLYNLVRSSIMMNEYYPKGS